jgi:hypothetical protein
MWNNFDTGYPILEDLTKSPYDVILLGASNVKFKINGQIIKAFCAHSYLVHKDYYESLLKNYKEGLLLAEKTRKFERYSLDQYWNLLIKCGKWFCVSPFLMIQRPSYSNILNKMVNYNK